MRTGIFCNTIFFVFSHKGDCSLHFTFLWGAWTPSIYLAGPLLSRRISIPAFLVCACWFCSLCLGKMSKSNASFSCFVRDMLQSVCRMFVWIPREMNTTAFLLFSWENWGSELISQFFSVVHRGDGSIYETVFLFVTYQLVDNGWRNRLAATETFLWSVGKYSYEAWVHYSEFVRHGLSVCLRNELTRRKNADVFLWDGKGVSKYKEERMP